jgi:hypothetical protein
VNKRDTRKEGREREGEKVELELSKPIVFSGLKHWIDEKKLIKIKAVMIIIMI